MHPYLQLKALKDAAQPDPVEGSGCDNSKFLLDPDWYSND
jgi:hypothetical protein